MRINFDKLKEKSPRTARTIARDLDLYKPSGEIEIELNDARLGFFTRGELTAFSAAQEAQRVPDIAAPKPAPPPAPVEKKKPEEDDSELRERAVDEAEGLLRVEHYVKLGLIDTPENGKLLLDFVNSTARGRWSASVVDKAIQSLGNKLTWKPKVVETPPAPPAPATPQPAPVEVLPNGEPRLPLGTAPTHKHSVAQLRDLDQRTRRF